MKRVMLACAAMSAQLLGAAVFDKFDAWFAQDYAGFDPLTWSDTCGTWTRSANDDSGWDAEAGALKVDTNGDDLDFSPATQATTGSSELLTAEINFGSALVDLEDFEPGDKQAALTLVNGETSGTFAFAGLDGGKLVRLSADGIVASTGTTYGIEIEIDYNYSPASVAYRVGGKTLADANGRLSFSASGTAKRITAVGVNGSGVLGEFSGGVRKGVRATVSPSRLRPRVGKAISFSATTNESCTLTGETTCRWRSVGWNGADASAYVTGDTYTPSAGDYGKWIVAELYDDSGYAGEGKIWFSRLPVAYIDVADGAWPTAQKEEHDATMFLGGNDDLKDQYDGAMTIKVRGNSTASQPKKPYKLKLASKTKLCDIGSKKNKHWVLIANYFDESLMRNKLAYDFSSNFGMTYMQSTWVDVVFNGSYNGNYLLCQHIRVGEDRVDVFDWEGAMEDAGGTAEDLSSVDTETTDVSGGYLYELSNEYDELSKFVVTSRTVAVATMLNKPEYLYTNPGMMAAAKKPWQDFWDACTATNGCNAQGVHYSQLADVDTLVGFLLTVEIFRNNDASFKSRYAYKEIGEPLRFGPVWDFDWGFGSPVIRQSDGNGGWLEPTATGWCVARYSSAVSLNSDKSIVGRPGFYKEWCDDPWFCHKLFDAYWKVRPKMAELIADGGTVDKYRALLAESGAANEGRWFYRIGFSGESGDALWVKTFLTRRFAWLDQQFETVETLMASLKTSASAAPYTRSESVAAAFPAGEDAETSPVAAATVSAATAVPVAVSAEGASKVLAYVNGLPAGSSALEGGAASLSLAAGLFAAGVTNVVAIDAADAAGNVLERTYARVLAVTKTAPSSTTGASVDHEWIRQYYPAVTNNEWEAAAPSDYAELADKVDEKGLSPLGKSVPFSYDYLAGTDPRDTNDFFTVSIAVGEDGKFEVTPKPNLGAARAYTILGKETLDPKEEWLPATESSRFFRIKVNMP